MSRGVETPCLVQWRHHVSWGVDTMYRAVETRLVGWRHHVSWGVDTMSRVVETPCRVWWKHHVSWCGTIMSRGVETPCDFKTHKTNNKLFQNVTKIEQNVVTIRLAIVHGVLLLIRLIHLLFIFRRRFATIRRGHSTVFRTALKSKPPPFLEPDQVYLRWTLFNATRYSVRTKAFQTRTKSQPLYQGTAGR